MRFRARVCSRFVIAGVSAALLAAVAIASSFADRGATRPHGGELAGPTTQVAASAVGWEFQSRAGDAARLLQETAHDDPNYSGIALDSARQALVIYRTGGAASPLYPNVVDGVPVVFKGALLTASEAQATVAAIVATTPDLASAGVTLMDVQPTLDGPVVVHLSSADSAAIVLIAKSVPDGPASVEVSCAEGPIGGSSQLRSSLPSDPPGSAAAS